MSRLAVLGLSLEANTFATYRTTIESMAAAGEITRGQQMVERFGDSTSTLGGFLDPEVPSDVELVPLIYYDARPGGQFAAATYDEATQTMVALLHEQGPFDAVLLALHGAAVAENVEQADNQTASLVRRAVGPHVPIGVVLDMHGNVDREIVDTVEVLRIFQTNPHVDAKDQALECRSLILDILAGVPKPVTVLRQLPLVVNIVKQDTSEQPLAGILARCRELERGALLDVSVCEGFPYADVEQMGMAVLASHRTDRAAAQAAADEIAVLLWAAREQLQAGGVTAEQALLGLAESGSGRPTLLLDVGDNVGGGSKGDSTTILNEAVRLGVGNFVISLWDPDAVASLADVPIGREVDVVVGGHSVEQDGSPQPLHATVVARSDGSYEDPKPTHGGFRHYNAGPSVALRTANDIVVVLTSIPTGTTSPEQFRSLGVEPTDFAAVVAKGMNSPKAGFGPLCDPWVAVDTPGVTRLSVDKFTYRRRRTPMYPYEPVTLD